MNPPAAAVNPPAPVRRRTAPVARLLLGAAAAVTLALGAGYWLEERRSLVADLEAVENFARTAAGRRIENPRYTTRRPDGRPLFVSADWALPGREGRDQVLLENVVATSANADDRKLIAHAARGQLIPRQNRLVLTGGVEYAEGTALKVSASRVVFDTDERVLRGAGEVTLDAPGLRVRADRMVVRDRPEGRITGFSGGVRATYRPGREDHAQ